MLILQYQQYFTRFYFNKRSIHVPLTLEILKYENTKFWEYASLFVQEFEFVGSWLSI